MNRDRLKISALLLLGVLIFFSCQKDEQVVESDYTGKQIAVTGQTHQKVRTILNGFNIEWVSGDQIGVYSPQSEATNEQYTAESSAAFSAFDGNMNWGTGAHSFYAYYPYTTGSFDYTTVPIALSASQMQAEGDNANHLSVSDFMIARPLIGVNLGESVQFQFEHLFTLLEFRVVGSGNLSKIELAADAQTKLAFASGSIDISQAKPSAETAYSINYSGSSSSAVALTLSSPAVLTSNDATTPALYMMVNSIDLTGQEISVTVTIDGVEKTITSDGFYLDRGQKYRLVVDPDKGTTNPEDDRFSVLNSSLAQYTVSAEQYQRLIDGSLFYGELYTITNSVYSHLNDDFDFIFYVLDTPRDDQIVNGLGFYGVNMSVSNAVEGLGNNIYSNSEAWGSAGKLKSVMYLPYDEAIVRGPALHELAHCWAAFIVPTYDIDDSSMGGHWGLSNAGGQLGGFSEIVTVEENSGGVTGKTLYRARYLPKNPLPGYIYPYGNFGTYANGGNGLAFSDIELYLMGMKSAQELREENFTLDIYSGNSFSAEGEYSFGDGYFWSTIKTSYTIDDIIALNGTRIPDATSSQKSFNVLTIALTQEEQTENTYDEITKGISWFAGGMSDKTYGDHLHNFQQATYGVGTLVIDGVQNSLKLQTGGTKRRVSTATSDNYQNRIHIDKADERLLAPRY